eukprot:NODE_682_length_4785_cov_0.471831.p5 type:complete len:168 gc:universal NODE_682_length_4785_cov_0.471831:530-1033(+)
MNMLNCYLILIILNWCTTHCELIVSNGKNTANYLVKYGKLTPLQPYGLLHDSLYCREYRNKDSKQTVLPRLKLNVIENEEKLTSKVLAEGQRYPIIDGVIVYFKSDLLYAENGKMSQTFELQSHTNEIMKLQNGLEIRIRHIFKQNRIIHVNSDPISTSNANSCLII